jgi:uncharacterized protein
MKHLTLADYRVMPWANGRGQTVELIRQNDDSGNILYRLSMATVTEDGPFSVFPGLNRNLTVIEGPGFDLVGDGTLRADPMVPVAFAGNIQLSAKNVTAPSRDFNVMAAMPLTMDVAIGGLPSAAKGATHLHFHFALEDTLIGAIALARHDMIYGPEALDTTQLPVLCVRIGPLIRSGTKAAPGAATTG